MWTNQRAHDYGKSYGVQLCRTSKSYDIFLQQWRNLAVFSSGLFFFRYLAAQYLIEYDNIFLAKSMHDALDQCVGRTSIAGVKPSSNHDDAEAELWFTISDVLHVVC